jgi:tetratricopeptide (TPR) repeat protein
MREIVMAQDTFDNLFNRALQAARVGDRQRACDYLRLFLEANPNNEQAWLWLADQSSDLDEQITALEQALDLNPHRSPARSRLDKLRAQQQSSWENPEVNQAQTWLDQAEKHYRRGQKEQAFENLLRYIEVDESNPRVWYMLAELAPGLDDRIVALENVLTLAPTHAAARAQLDKLRRAVEDPLTLGIHYEEQGNMDRAINQYIQASMQANSIADRLEARRRLEYAQLKVLAPDYKPISPRLTLGRLAVGPVLMFAVLLFLHGGMRILPILIPLFLGSASILLGGGLIAVTNSMPLLSYWFSWWQKRGLRNETGARAALLALGVILLLGPYALLFAHAFIQLDAYLKNFPLQ